MNKWVRLLIAYVVLSYPANYLLMCNNIGAYTIFANSTHRQRIHQVNLRGLSFFISPLFVPIITLDYFINITIPKTEKSNEN